MSLANYGPIEWAMTSLISACAFLGVCTGVWILKTTIFGDF